MFWVFFVPFLYKFAFFSARLLYYSQVSDSLVPALQLSSFRVPGPTKDVIFHDQEYDVSLTLVVLEADTFVVTITIHQFDMELNNPGHTNHTLYDFSHS